MTGLASPSQIRMSFLRWAIVAVPLIVLLGSLSGGIGGSAGESSWYAALQKPALVPPGWVFGVAWTILYALMGLALAMILNARGAYGRPAALTLFGIQLALNLAWSPLFFGAHRIQAAFWLILAIFFFALLTTLAFGRIRKWAAWVMVPYLAWLCFAAVLNWQIMQLNPGGTAPGVVEYQLS